MAPFRLMRKLLEVGNHQIVDSEQIDGVSTLETSAPSRVGAGINIACHPSAMIMNNFANSQR